MGRGSSGHIDAGHSGYFYHNDRSHDTKNAQFFDEQNEYSCSANEAMQLYRQELATRTQAYTARTNQKLQKNIVTHRSVIVNLEKHHTLKDLEKVKNYLEVSLDTKVLQIAIHRDEGYIDKDTGKVVKNYHAHIEMMGLDSTGTSIAQNQLKKSKKETKEEFEKRKEKFTATRANRLDSKFYTKWQTFLANTLEMERGKRGSKAKRLDTYDYKREAEIRSDLVRAAKQQETRELKLTVSALKKEIATLRTDLKEKNAELAAAGEQKVYTKEDYQAINKLKKALNKDTVKEIYQAYLALQKELLEKEKTIKSLNEVNEDLQKEVFAPAEKYKTKAGKPVKNVDVLKHLEKKLSEAQESIKALKASNDTLKSDLKRSEQNMSVLEVENKSLSTANSQLSTEIDEKDKTISFLKEKSEATESGEVVQLKAKVQELEKENKELKKEVSYLRSMHEKNTQQANDYSIKQVADDVVISFKDSNLKSYFRQEARKAGLSISLGTDKKSFVVKNAEVADIKILIEQAKDTFENIDISDFDNLIKKSSQNLKKN